MFDVPFTAEQFFDVFARYNGAVWPAPTVLAVLAVGAVGLSFRRSDEADRAVAGFLALLWAWTGLAYHLLFFTEINPAAWGFGALFLVQALLFMVYGAFNGRLSLEPRRDVYGWTGGALLLYALVIYPMLGRLTGHLYPATPTFGAPCPAVIFTFGLLLLARPRVPGWLLAIPAAWGVLGSSAVFAFGVVQDVGLLVAAVVGTTLILVRNRRAVPVGEQPPSVA